MSSSGPPSPSTAQTPRAPTVDLLADARARVREDLARTGASPQARERRVASQTLLAELATTFLGRSGSELDEALGTALARIGGFVGAERAALVEVESNSGVLTTTHDWAADGLSSLREALDGRRISRWSSQQLERGVILHVEDLDDLLPAAHLERKALSEVAVLSCIALPVRSGRGDLLGAVVFSTTSRRATWKEDEISMFLLTAEMLRNALEQQKFRAELERSEQRLHRLLESGTIGILSADREGRIWEANDAALKVIGAAREDVDTGRVRWDELTPAEYRPMTQGALEQLERSGCSEPWEQDIYRRDGSRVSILICTARLAETPDRFLIYAVDITVDKTAERELSQRARLGRLVTLFSTRLISVAPDRIGETIEDALRETGGVLNIDNCTVWLDEEGREGVAHCRFVWDRMRRVEKPLRLPPMDRSRFPRWKDDFAHRRPMVVHDVRKDLGEDQLERRFLERYGIRSGVAVPLLASQGPIGFATFGGPQVTDWPDATVSLLGVIGEIFAAALIRGRIEERQRRVHADLEERIVERTVQLESANRELEAFSYAVSHDLRAPLRGVDGFSRILVEDYAGGLPEGARDILGRIRATSQRMGKLIDSLLKLSRITRSEPHYERTDLSAVAREISASLASTDPTRLVDFLVEDGLVADGEPRLLEALLENLLRNAWKFTAPRPRACIEFGSEVVDGQRVYFVRDDGVGFDPSQAERLFTPFQRLHDPRDFEGHGVGLATVKRIAGVHGGRVWGEGEPDRGATIRFTLGERH